MKRTRLPGTCGPLRRGAALYIAVTVTTLLVSLLGLAGMAIMSIELRQSTSGNDQLIARSNSRSAVELALRNICEDPDWRTNSTSGVETTQLALNSNSAGTVSYIIEDSDGSFSDADTELKIKGVGRAGDAVQVSSIQIAEGLTIGPMLFKESTTQSSFEYVTAEKWWAQYVKPDLPPDAIEWRVTGVEFWLGKSGSPNQTLLIKLYIPDASNMPSTQVDGLSVAESTLTTTGTWVPFQFSGHSGLDPNQGVCVAMECGTSSTAAFFHYRTVGDTDPDSDLICGSQAGGWTTYDPSAALLFRLHGTYKTQLGVEAISGTWTADSYP